MPFEALQIRGSGGCVVTSPQIEMIDRVGGGNLESSQGRIEGLALKYDELQRRPIQTLEERQLELELDPHVPDMTDRAAEPRIESTLARSGDPVDDPIGTGRSWFGVVRLGQPGIDQAIEGPVHQGPSHRDHPPHLGIGLKCFRDGEAVGGPLGEQAENGVLGERWLELLHAYQSRVLN